MPNFFNIADYPAERVGVIDGSAVPAGLIGETLSVHLLISDGVTIPTSIEQVVTSLSLAAGRWMVFGQCVIDAANGCTPTTMIGGITTGIVSELDDSLRINVAFAANVRQSFVVPLRRFNLSATTTINLCMFSIYGGAGLLKVGGEMVAMRIG